MLFTIITVLILLFLIAKLYLSGPDLTLYDNPVGQHFPSHPEDQQATERFLTTIRAVRTSVKEGKSIKAGLRAIRTFADELSDDLTTDTEFKSVIANGVPCEWAIAKGANKDHRVLFLHGGAFLFGSPKGHRKMSDKLAKITNGVVLSVDYRLLPEHRRGASIEDAQKSYLWLLDNAPDAKAEVSKLLIAGDSAGGNLALMLSGWSKTGARRRPNAVIGFSPSTDTTLASPTIISNQRSDKMLGQGLGLLTKLPMPIRVWVGACLMRCNPADPLVSPLFQDLSGLAPTLIHASSSEMLLGEARRYTNKAQISGSNVKLQVWDNQVHDWHLMNMGYGSANVAWEEIEKFLADTFFRKTGETQQI